MVAAFCYDPLATFLLMAAIALLVTPRLSWRRTAGAGVAVALAGLVTMKAVFYLPPILALAALQLAGAGDRGRVLRRLLAGGVAGIAAYGGGFVLHSLDVAGSAEERAVSYAAMSAGTMLDPSTLLRMWPYLVHAVAGSPLTFLSIAAGLAVAVTGTIRAGGKERLRSLAIVASAFPLGTILFYRNSAGATT